MSDTMHPEEPMTEPTPNPGETAQPQDVQRAEAAPDRPSTQLGALASGHEEDPAAGREAVFDLKDVSVSYSGKLAIRDVDLTVHCNLVTAFIGPSGCGKTTLLRSLNRLNDLIPSASLDGMIRYHGYDLSSSSIDPVE